MKTNITNISDAFIALNDVDDEAEIEALNLQEAKSFKIADKNAMEDAQKFREESKAHDGDVDLEVIDPDADVVQHLKDKKSYIGQMILQCNSCKAPRFIDAEKLVANPNDPELYNEEDECPNCHNTGTGYTLIAQVGKKPEPEQEVENDEVDKDETAFDNDLEDDVPESTEAQEEEEKSTEEASDNDDEEKESNWDETDDEDDTLELPVLGEGYDPDDVSPDDTILEEDNNNGFYKVEYSRILPANIFKNSNQEGYLYVFAKNADYAKRYVANHIDQAMVDNVTEVNFSDIPDNEKIADSITGWYSNSIRYLHESSDKNLAEDLDIDIEGKNAEAVESEILQAQADEIMQNSIEDQEIEDLEEDLDLSTWAGSISDFLEAFVLEDSDLVVKVFNKNGTKVGTFNRETIPFDIASLTVDTFNTEDNVIDLEVTEDEDSDNISVSDLFSSYRMDEDSEITFLVQNLDTDEDSEFNNTADLISEFGNYKIANNIQVKTLNIYTNDTDVETDVEELPDEVIEVLPDNVAESLYRNIIHNNHELKANRISNPNSDEYFIAESIRLREDLDKVFDVFIKPTKNKELIEQFKSYTGYEDEVDKFLKEHNISREKYDKIINEDYNIDDYLEDLAADSCKENNFISDYDDFKAICSQEGFNDVSRADFGIYQKLCKKGKKAKVNEEADKKNYIIKTTFNHSDYYVADKNEWEVARSTDENINIFVRLPELDKYFTFHPYSFRAYVFTKEQALKLMNIIKNNPKCQNSGLVKVIIEKFKDDVEEEVKPETTTFNEKLLTSVKDRAELSKLVSKLDESKTKYKINKSLNEGYRYDVYVNEDCNLKESPLTFEPAAIEDDAIDGEVLDAPEPNTTETGIVPENMDPRDVEVVTKINRIADTIHDSILNNYNVDVPKNLIAADIIQDLKLIGGEVLADDLENTPANEVTKELYRQFNGAYDALDSLVSFITGEQVTTSQAQRLANSLEALDGKEFTPEYIEKGISSDQFLGMAAQGMVPYVDAREIVRKNADRVRALPARFTNGRVLAYNPEEDDRFAELETPATAQLPDPENDVEESLNESVDFGSFDECVNDYLYNTYDESLSYFSLKSRVNESKVEIDGILNSRTESKPITFYLSKNLNESANQADIFDVTNNISDEVIKYQVKK